MKIIFTTYSNQINAHYKRYISSCQHNNIKPIVLGLSDKKFTFKNKIIRMEKLLDTLDKNDIVVFTDCWDVIILANKSIILDKFLSLNVPLLISTEKCKQCILDYPNRNWVEEDKHYPYLNSGSYMGYVKQLKIIFKLFRKNNYFETIDDQAMFYALCIKYPEFKILDYKQEIFGNNSGCKVTNFGLKYIDNTFKRLFTKKYAMFDEFKLDKQNRLINKKTNKQALILHCPGKNFLRIDNIAYQLGYYNTFFLELILFTIDKILLYFSIIYFLYISNFYVFLFILLLLCKFNKKFDSIRKNLINKLYILLT